MAAVSEQGDPGPFIRRLREAIMLERRPMDTAPALLDAARETGGLDLERLRVDFGSNAIVERFGADLERGRGATTPAVRFGPDHEVAGYAPYERLREAALAAGAEPSGDGHPGIEEALRRFGPMATPEVAAVCDLPARGRRPSCGGSRSSGACGRGGCSAASCGSSRRPRRQLRLGREAGEPAARVRRASGSPTSRSRRRLGSNTTPGQDRCRIPADPAPSSRG